MNFRIQTTVAGLAIAAAASLAGTPAIASARPGPTDPSPAPQPAASAGVPKAAASIPVGGTESVYYRDRDQTTTINLRSGVTTNIRLSSSTSSNAQTGEAKYNVTMYQGNKVVWSATNQTTRVYTVGGNVTKIVMTRIGNQFGSNLVYR